MNNFTHSLHAKVDGADRITPARHQAALAIAVVYAQAIAGADVVELLHGLLVEALEPREREIYEWFLSGRAGGYTTSRRVAEVFEISHTDSSTKLKFLCEVGLLERTQYAHAHGRRYFYGLPGVYEEVFQE